MSETVGNTERSIDPVRRIETAMEQASVWGLEFIKSIDDLKAENARLRSQRAALLEALEKAKQFIVNGVEFGYIQMPERGDPALETLPAIQSVLKATKESV